MAVVASLWVGGPLGRVQEICLASFVYHRHEIYLYVYDLEMKVPDGVKKLDANLIIPESEIFYYHGQLAGFSDWFRYKMIQATGMMWVDADTLCLNDQFFEDDDFVFIRESPSLIAGGILKMPKGHIATRAINQQADKVVKQIKSMPDKKQWAQIGPLLLTKVAKRFQLTAFAQPFQLVNVLDHWSKGEDFWNPDKKEQILEDCVGAFSATMFTGTLRAKGFDTNQELPSGSAIEYFANRFGIKWS